MHVGTWAGVILSTPAVSQERLQACGRAVMPATGTHPPGRRCIHQRPLRQRPVRSHQPTSSSFFGLSWPSLVLTPDRE